MSLGGSSPNPNFILPAGTSLQDIIPGATSPLPTLPSGYIDPNGDNPFIHEPFKQMTPGGGPSPFPWTPGTTSTTSTGTDTTAAPIAAPTTPTAASVDSASPAASAATSGSSSPSGGIGAVAVPSSGIINPSNFDWPRVTNLVTSDYGLQSSYTPQQVWQAEFGNFPMPGTPGAPPSFASGARSSFQSGGGVDNDANTIAAMLSQSGAGAPPPMSDTAARIGSSPITPPTSQPQFPMGYPGMMPIPQGMPPQGAPPQYQDGGGMPYGEDRPGMAQGGRVVESPLGTLSARGNPIAQVLVALNPKLGNQPLP